MCVATIAKSVTFCHYLYLFFVFIVLIQVCNEGEHKFTEFLFLDELSLETGLFLQFYY